MNEVAKYVDKLPFWNKLSEDEKKYTAENTTMLSYAKHSIIHGFSDSCLGMIYILRGSIRVYILSEEGREVTLFRLERGDVCLLSASCVITQITFDTQIVVEKDCNLLVLSACAFSKITEENIYARCYMYELAAERFSTIMWSMQQVLFARLDQRLAGFLIKEYVRSGNNSLFMTHDQIAVQISSAREVVARMLKRFAADGLVEMKRGVIVLLDIDKLRDLL